MTTKSYRKKTKRAQKKAPPKPAETPPPAAAPHPLAEAETLFDDGIPREDTTLLQLIRGMFDAPNASKSGNATADFLSDVLLATADDMYLVQNLNSGLDSGDIIDRVLLRATWRAEFAAEIARRVEKGLVLR